MGKILALDYGTKRVGLAVSDADQTMAFPRETILRNPSGEFENKLKKLVKEEGISKIILGVPLDSDNLETNSSKKIRNFGQKLAKLLGLPVEFVDEHGTSNLALSSIPLRKDRKAGGGKDAIAAYFILMRYLKYDY